MSNLSLLVVDDSSTMRRILKQTLSKLGYEDVEEAADGAEGLVKCKDKVFDVVFTDWNMPEVDGLEFTQKLRTKQEYSDVPIIMVTTEGSKSDVVEALTKGVTSYIVKPFTPDTLKEKLESVIG